MMRHIKSFSFYAGAAFTGFSVSYLENLDTDDYLFSGEKGPIVKTQPQEKTPPKLEALIPKSSIDQNEEEVMPPSATIEQGHADEQDQQMFCNMGPVSEIYELKSALEITDDEYDGVIDTYHKWLYKESFLHNLHAPALTETSNGITTLEEWRVAGRRHRIGGGPARVQYFLGGGLRSEGYYHCGDRHRIGEPAEISYYMNGALKSETYFKDDVYHREDGAADIRYDAYGNITEFSYFLNGKRHREGGPARVVRNDDGSLAEEGYYIIGVQHREDGPARTTYYSDGTIGKEIYKYNGEFHREGGPAIIEYKPDGSIRAESYFLHGVYQGSHEPNTQKSSYKAPYPY